MVSLPTLEGKEYRLSWQRHKRYPVAGAVRQSSHPHAGLPSLETTSYSDHTCVPAFYLVGQAKTRNPH